MRLSLTPDSRVLIDLRASGILRAVGHDPTLVARCDALSLELGADGAHAIMARFPVARIEVPADLSASDADRMRDNLRGREVLDAATFPEVVWRGRYAGDRAAGRLEGELVVRGAARAVSLDVRVAREGEELMARGTWTGRLTDLGIKPFRALMGALKLEDSIVLRLEARFLSLAGEGTPSPPGE